LRASRHERTIAAVFSCALLIAVALSIPLRSAPLGTRPGFLVSTQSCSERAKASRPSSSRGARTRSAGATSDDDMALLTVYFAAPLRTVSKLVTFWVRMRRRRRSVSRARGARRRTACRGSAGRRHLRRRDDLRGTDRKRAASRRAGDARRARSYAGRRRAARDCRPMPIRNAAAESTSSRSWHASSASCRAPAKPAVTPGWCWPAE
jgi:hypothetical protein